MPEPTTMSNQHRDGQWDILPSEEFEWHGDYWVSTKTGEIKAVRGEPVQFQVRDKESAEWVLAKLMAHDTRIAALELQKKAVVANIDAQIQDELRGKAWLQLRFGDQLKAWAKSQLTGKARSVRTAYGRLSFRKVAAKVTVLDKDAALFWCREKAPEAIQTSESILLSELKKHMGEIPRNSGMRVEPEHESFRFDTGVDA